MAKAWTKEDVYRLHAMFNSHWTGRFNNTLDESLSVYLKRFFDERGYEQFPPSKWTCVRALLSMKAAMIPRFAGTSACTLIWTML